MDIHSWLQTTADRQPPDEEEHPGIPDFLKPQGPPEAKRRERHRTRKRPSSEPPSSERHHHHRKRHRAATWSSSRPDHARKLQPSATGSHSSSHASHRRHVRSATDQKAVPDESFERRARHKTRPDRYEAKPKQRSDGRRAHDKRKSKSKGRKSRQNGDIAKATGMIQSFQLKNGRKDKRLTLRPDANVGIFKHGRSSGPVAINGPGLPDLVFNEMKFLQRPHEHQDEVPVKDTTTKQSKKSKQQLREEEISAYFVRKPVLEGAAPRRSEANGRPQAETVNYGVNRSTDERRPASSELHTRPAGDSIDLPQRPFLGFGSKGPSHESNTHDPASYLTWSESVAVVQQRPLRESYADTGHQVTDEGARDRDQRRLPTKNSGSHGLRQPRKFNASTTENGRRSIETSRVRRQGHFEIYEPASNVQATARHATDQSAASIAESLPDRRAKAVSSHSSKSSNRDQTRDYRTSDVLKIVDDDRVVDPSISSQHQHSEERQNRSSTPTSDLLRRAFDAVNNAAINQVPDQVRTKPVEKGEMESRQRQRQVNIHDTGYRPASQAHSSRATQPKEHGTVPCRGFSRAVGAQNTQQRQPLQCMSASTMNAGPRWRPPSRATLSMHDQHRMEDDMLKDIHRDFGQSDEAEDGRRRRPYQALPASTMNASSRWPPPSRFESVPMMHHEPLMENRLPDHLQDVYPDDDFMQAQEVDIDQSMPFAEDRFHIDLPTRRLVTQSPRFGADSFSTRGPSSILHDAPLSNPSTDRVSGHASLGENDENHGGDGGMGGFWRPNVLY